MGNHYKIAQIIWECEELQDLHDLATTFNQTYKQKVRQLRDKKEIEDKFGLKVGSVLLPK